MSQSSTNVPQAQPAESDQSVTDNPLQQFGYVRVYRAVRKDVGTDAAYLYGVLEDFAQMSARRKVPCMPTYQDLANNIGVPARTLERWLTTLRKSGWIETEKLRGGRIRYNLKSAPIPSLDSSLRKNAECQPPNLRSASPANLRSTESKPNVKLANTKASSGVGDATRTPAREENSFSESPVSENGQDRSGQAPTKPVSNQVGTSPEERNPYWTDPAHITDRLDLFNDVAGHYPNKGADRMSAMAAWRQTIGTRLDGKDEPDPLYMAVWYGVQWYARQVRDKGKENYVIGFPKWIRDERWNDAPESDRKGVAA